jgi:hypothetical protein
MTTVNKKILQVVLALTVVAGGLYFALRNVNLAEVGRELRQADWRWVGLTALLLFVTLLIRAQRWRILLGRAPSLPEAFGLIGVGYLISGILPLRLGDPARAVAAGLRTPVSTFAALSTVVVERALDLLLVVLMLVVTLPFVPGLQAYLQASSTGGSFSNSLLVILSGVASLSLLVVLALVALYPQRVESFVLWTLTGVRVREPERFLRPLHKVLEGLVALRSPREGLAVLLWSVVLWAVTAAYFATALRAFTPQATFLQATVTTWASAFGMIFPAPGGIGSFHYAVQQSLNLGFGVGKELGLAYATVVHGVAYVTGIVVGAGALTLWGISLGQLNARSQALKAEPEARADVAPGA